MADGGSWLGWAAHWPAMPGTRQKFNLNARGPSIYSDQVRRNPAVSAWALIPSNCIELNRAALSVCRRLACPFDGSYLWSPCQVGGAEYQILNRRAMVGRRERHPVGLAGPSIDEDSAAATCNGPGQRPCRVRVHPWHPAGTPRRGGTRGCCNCFWQEARFWSTRLWPRLTGWL
jgi:hypothetical protein